jgi:hypothetical protein
MGNRKGEKMHRRLFDFLREVINRKKKENKVAVVVDLENIMFNLFESRPERFVAMYDVFMPVVEKLKAIGSISGIFFFLPSHMEATAREFFFKIPGCFLVVCPKETSGGMNLDTVDSTIKKFCEGVISQMPGITHLCLFSGDKDYVPTVKALKREGIKIAIAAGNTKSLARELMEVASKEPRGGKKMIYILTPK